MRRSNGRNLIGRLVILLAVAGMLIAPTTAAADPPWPCDGPEEWMIDEYNNGNWGPIMVYWNWRNSPQGHADCGD